jgi:hypothetical protein
MSVQWEMSSVQNVSTVYSRNEFGKIDTSTAKISSVQNVSTVGNELGTKCQYSIQ